MTVNRRDFMKMSAAGVTTPWLMNLSSMAHAADAGDDYKALVCVFLAGGNDHNNTLIPFDAKNYKAYQAIRPDVAVSQSSILPLLQPTPLPFGMKMGLNQNMVGMQKLFNQGNMAVLLNVGPLIQPTTKAQYKKNQVALPPKLFSHNDQRAIWKSSQTEGAKQGWGGRIADQKLTTNTNALFSCISISGTSVFLAGEDASQFNVLAHGVQKIRGAKADDWIWGGREVAGALSKLIVQDSQHPLEQAHADITKRAVKAESILTAALDGQPEIKTQLPDTKLGKQLAMVAKLIQARKKVGVKRQVFYVQMGGFDTHDELLSEHGALLKELSEAMTAFYDATVELGVSNQVTSFTASDFGRTFVSNGDGSDHGWGGHHFILGGAVKGKAFYGTAPEIALDTKDDVGKGRLLPTTSVDQYAATLASWFGVPDAKLETVSPNLKNFPIKTLGFV